MIAFFVFVTLVGFTAMMTARLVNRRPALTSGRSAQPALRPSDGAGQVPSPHGGWTALDEIQLIRLLTDAASS